MSGLEKDFVIVSWDQRGSGKSYHEGIDPNTLTFDQIYADTYELILKMKERFGVNKVYLMGISWGSILGINIANEYPELLYSYIGVSQVVNAERGIEISYNTVYETAIGQDNQTAITELSGIHIDSTWEHKEIISKWIDEFGFGDFHDEAKASQIREALAASLTEYTSEDITNLDKGKALYDQSPLGNDLIWLRNIDMSSQIPSLEIPVYFLAGNFDYKTPSQLVDEYLQILISPMGKKLIMFENSAHIPILEEREIFHDSMINTVLVETQ
jgi:pimeloyl-ACP methyl ester carboxylesterase